MFLRCEEGDLVYICFRFIFRTGGRSDFRKTNDEGAGGGKSQLQSFQSLQPRRARSSFSHFLSPTSQYLVPSSKLRECPRYRRTRRQVELGRARQAHQLRLPPSFHPLATDHSTTMALCLFDDPTEDMDKVDIELVCRFPFPFLSRLQFFELKTTRASSTSVLSFLRSKLTLLAPPVPSRPNQDATRLSWRLDCCLRRQMEVVL